MSQLLTLSLKELQALCVANKIKKSGTKGDLIARLGPVVQQPSIEMDIVTGTLSHLSIHEEIDVDHFAIEEEEYPLIHELATAIAVGFFSMDKEACCKRAVKSVRKGTQKRREQIAVAIWFVFTLETESAQEQWRKEAILQELIANGREKF